MNQNPSSVSDFCSKIFACNSHFVPFRCQFPASMHPDKSTGWIHGYCTLQNSNYTYDEVMTIVASTATNNYIGAVVASNGSPRMGQWHKVGTNIIDTGWVKSYTLSSSVGDFYYILDTSAIYRISHLSYEHTVLKLAGASTLKYSIGSSYVTFSSTESGANIRLFIIHPYQ